MKKKTIIGAGALGAAALVAGAVVAFSGAANAATVDSSPAAVVSTTSSTTPSAPTNATPPVGDPTKQRSDETIVTGAKADTLTAAAKAKVAGASVIRVETDADGAAYEVHMKKADGSLTTVLFNSDLSVKSVEQGMGGGPKGAPHGQAPAGAPVAPNGAGPSSAPTQTN